MTQKRKALIISTSADRLDDGVATGLWLGELAAPYFQMKDAGIDVDIASVKGGGVPVVARRIEEEHDSETIKRFDNDSDLQFALTNTTAFDTVKMDEYDAIFFPGGHGAMVDYPKSEDLARLVGKWLLNDKTVAAVCHGPAVLVNAKDEDGASAIAGRTLTGFSNSEESKSGLAASVPFALESGLREQGAEYASGADFTPFAVQDANLITGQNPQSAELVGKLLVDRLLSKSEPDARIVLDGADDAKAA